MGEGGRQLPRHGEALLAAQFLAQEGIALGHGGELGVLGLELGQGCVDAVLEVGVQAADLADEGLALLPGALELDRHAVELGRDEAQFVAAPDGDAGPGLAALQPLHGQHRGLDGVADEHAQDEPEQDELAQQDAWKGAVGALQVVVPHDLPALQVAVDPD